MQFIFDPSKDELNVRKHGISLDQASVVFNHPNKIEGKVDSVDRQRITAKYFRRSNLKKNRQMLGIYIGI